jgi:hypothetical protein
MSELALPAAPGRGYRGPARCQIDGPAAARSPMAPRSVDQHCMDRRDDPDQLHLARDHTK